MSYKIEFTAPENGKVSLTVEKNSRAKIVNAALKTGGITAVVTVNKVVDFNAPKKTLSAKALAAIEKRKKERAAAEKKSGK